MVLLQESLMELWFDGTKSPLFHAMCVAPLEQYVMADV